ncbi:hypothetical protein CF68_07375 [Cupriavidus sp. SK-4]|uniref:ABC transporter permease n=1 Tax=Cupriavidus sp. SK-4 TaxID=574750 RepID=UPI000446EB29|nr:DUF3526 domain-containing protein [Cupriavidus sp. SK-4]EYS86098.1 hypothetical protein CF68_07375 [Cupriavidus sp. SK-4]
MIRTVVVKELRAMAREGRFAALLVIGAAVLAVAFLASLQRHAAVASEVAQVAAATRQQWDDQGDKHPHRGAHFGLYVFRPASALTVIEPGLGDYFGQALWLEPHRRNVARFEPAQDALPSTRFGDLSAGFVFAVLLPLLVIAVTFDAVSGERQRGTLRMMHGAGVAPARLVAGKFLALGAGFAVFALAVALAPVIAASAGGTLDGAVWWRAAGLGAGYLLYAAILVGLGLAVSAWVADDRSALFVLVGLWLAFVFVIPGMGAAVARHAVPLPSAQAFWAAIQRDYTEGLPGDGNLAARTERHDAALLARYGVTRLADLPVGAAPLRRLERDAYADRVHALHFDALWQRYAAQENVMRAAALLSPTLAIRNFAMKMAGTDLSHQRDYEAAAERYRRSVNTAIDEWDASHTRGMTSFDARYAGAALWRAIRPFAYAMPPARFALRAALPEIAIMFWWCGLAAAGLFFSLRRIQP